MKEITEVPDMRFQTMRHIETVRNFLNLCVCELLKRGEQHDQSKLESPEVEEYNLLTQRLRGITYGTQEYRDNLKDFKEAIIHHYAHNRHHPEWAEYNIEKWKPVVGYEGLYEVSNLGQVRSLTRVVKRDGSRGDLTKNGQTLRGFVTPKGYIRLQLSKENITKNFMVHRLVAEAFILNPKNKPEVNHKNGNKRDNRVENLEWATSSENLQHAYDTELKESNAKYVVHCVELDITTIGSTKMEYALRERGYKKASSSAIWSCINGNCNTHLDLTFEGTLLTEWRHSQFISMTLIDVLEMFCDWKAAGLRHADGDIYKSIEINHKRFGFSDELRIIMENTAKWLDGEQVFHKAYES